MKKSSYLDDSRQSIDWVPQSIDWDHSHRRAAAYCGQDGDDGAAGDAPRLEELKKKAVQNLALDASGALTYLAPNLANLRLAQERWSEVAFHATREL